MSGSMEDYLKKYLSDEPNEKHKYKKKSKDASHFGFKIVESDIETWENPKRRENRKEITRGPFTSKTKDAFERAGSSGQRSTSSDKKWKIVNEVESEVKELIDSGVPLTIVYDKSLEEKKEDDEEDNSVDLPRTPVSQNSEVRSTRDGEGEHDADASEQKNTVYRDEYGKVIDIAKYEKLIEEKRQRFEKGRLEDLIWKKGIKQVLSAYEEKEKRDKEKSSYLSVHEREQDSDKALRKKVHWGDPSREDLSRKKIKKLNHQVYNGPEAPPNRYDIQPGYRWDGVDRSNGFEKKYFIHVNKKLAEAAEHYAWSTEDM